MKNKQDRFENCFKDCARTGYEMETTYNGDLKSVHSGLFEGQISNGPALAMAMAIVSSIQKRDHSKSGHFCLDLNWFRKNGSRLFK